MKRHKSLIPLSRDHKSGLLVAQLIKLNAPEYRGLPTKTVEKAEYAIQKYETELVPHFTNEEEILFPFIKKQISELDSLIVEIFNEHQKIHFLFDELKKRKNNLELLNELGNLLENHIRKEERILFEKIQTLIPPETLELLRNKIKPAGSPSCPTKD